MIVITHLMTISYLKSLREIPLSLLFLHTRDSNNPPLLIKSDDSAFKPAWLTYDTCHQVGDDRSDDSYFPT
jgi:hypothetical protein